jgi:hypothetical protein
MLGSQPNFTNGTTIDLTTSIATSDYDALQVQFQRRLSQGFQALASYSWAQSIDTASSDVNFQIPSQYVSPVLNRGPADFNVHHSFKTALMYEIPNLQESLIGTLFQHWSAEGIFTARTPVPVDITVNRLFGFDNVAARPDLVPGASPYLRDPSFPGGWKINPSAFVVPVEQRQGTLGRNALRGFPLSQLDVSAGRIFHMSEAIKLQLRADFFNVLNHPNFADPSGSLGSFGPPLSPNSLFGVSTAMANTPFNGTTNGLSPLFRVGGARSVQLSLRLSF